MFDRHRRLPRPLIGALGLVIGLLLVAILATPKVATVEPLPDSHHVPSTSHVSITFDQPMNTELVESRLTIEPLRAGYLSWDDNTLTFQPAEPWTSGSKVTVHLAGGARSRRFLPMIRSYSWSFTVGAPRILYLWPAGSPADLYATSPDGAEITRLTETSFGVLDYTLSAAGSKIAYAVAREDQGSDIYLLDLISGEQRLVHSCPENVLCQSLALDPEEKLLAFEKLEFKVGAAGKPVLTPSQVWAIDMSEGAEEFPIGPDNHVTTSPMWSPEGWLAYYDSTLRAIALVDVVSRPNPAVFNYMSNDMGLMGSWSPDGTFLLLSDIVFPQVEYGEENEEVEGQASFYSHLYRVNANSGFVVDLTAGNIGAVEDASPSYSPDGEWIAYTRKYLEEDRWTLGRQLWLMRSDGSDAYQFSDEPFYGHSSLAWSPDSSAIAYMRKGQLDISQPGEIWLIEIDEGEPKQLVVGGYLPQWIP